MGEKHAHGKMTAMDAENRARQFIRHRRPRANGVRFRRTWREGDVWMVEGEFWFKRLRLFTAKRSFRLQVSAETGEVASYEETKE